MNNFKITLPPAQLRRVRALDAWYRAFEDFTLRMEWPDGYHEELLRQADEMDRKGIVEWDECRDLRAAADEAYLSAVAGNDYHPVERKE